MKRSAPLVVLASVVMAAALLAVATPALAVERFPPPDFEGGHTLPSTSTPVADPLWYDIADGAALIVAMVVATWLVLRGRSRRGVLVLGALSLLYFGFWRQGCICSIGAVQNVALAGFDGGYALPLIAAVFFLVPVLFSLLFGRTFCAGVCPLGAIQELVAIKPVRVPTAIEEPLRTLPYVYLGAAVLFAATGSAFIICEYDPFVAFFRMSGPLGMLLLGAGMLVVGMFIVRPYCRYLCPYGIVLGWFSRFSHAHARIDPQQCINCRLCEDACPVSAITRPNDASRDGDEQAQQRTRLTKVAVALPVMVLSGAALGYALSPAMSRMHPTVSLAQRIAAEDAGLYDEPTLASEAFRATGEPAPQLYANAASIAGSYRIGTPLLGAFLGSVIGMKLLRLSARQRQDVYDIDRARCVSCARCFPYCPHDASNLAKLESLPPNLRQDGQAVALTIRGR